MALSSPPMVHCEHTSLRVLARLRAPWKDCPMLSGNAAASNEDS